MHRPVILRLLLLAVGAPVLLRGQASDQKPLAFDVASIKLNSSGGVAKEIGPAPDGHFHATNSPARDLIAFGYGVSQDGAAVRIVGAPRWVDDERYDVNAKVTGAWTPEQMREMVRTMLTDRCRLVAHRETRDMPTYSLVMASDRSTGLRRSQVDQSACDARRAAIRRREPVPPPVPGAAPICGSGQTIPGTITGVGFSIESLSTSLGRFVDRVVANNTRLDGLWDFELRWTPEQLSPVPPGAPAINVDPNGPSIFTALQEQLGLKLESTRGPVDIVVIDHVERPTPD
jgi:uncharacterized protein (TIGR03435 family)